MAINFPKLFPVPSLPICWAPIPLFLVFCVISSASHQKLVRNFWDFIFVYFGYSHHWMRFWFFEFSFLRTGFLFSDKKNDPLKNKNKSKKLKKETYWSDFDFFFFFFLCFFFFSSSLLESESSDDDFETSFFFFLTFFTEKLGSLIKEFIW